MALVWSLGPGRNKRQGFDPNGNNLGGSVQSWTFSVHCFVNKQCKFTLYEAPVKYFVTRPHIESFQQPWEVRYSDPVWGGEIEA